MGEKNSRFLCKKGSADRAARYPNLTRIEASMSTAELYLQPAGAINRGRYPRWLVGRLVARFGESGYRNRHGYDLLQTHLPQAWRSFIDHAGTLPLTDGRKAFVTEPYQSPCTLEPLAVWLATELQCCYRIHERGTWQTGTCRCTWVPYPGDDERMIRSKLRAIRQAERKRSAAQ